MDPSAQTARREDQQESTDCIDASQDTRPGNVAQEVVKANLYTTRAVARMLLMYADRFSCYLKAWLTSPEIAERSSFIPSAYQAHPAARA